MSCHVVTVNIGPLGLQATIEDLPALAKQHSTLPIVIHLQDIKLT